MSRGEGFLKGLKKGVEVAKDLMSPASAKVGSAAEAAKLWPKEAAARAAKMKKLSGWKNLEKGAGAGAAKPAGDGLLDTAGKVPKTPPGGDKWGAGGVLKSAMAWITLYFGVNTATKIAGNLGWWGLKDQEEMTRKAQTEMVLMGIKNKREATNKLMEFIKGQNKELDEQMWGMKAADAKLGEVQSLERRRSELGDPMAPMETAGLALMQREPMMDEGYPMPMAPQIPFDPRFPITGMFN